MSDPLTNGQEPLPGMPDPEPRPFPDLEGGMFEFTFADGITQYGFVLKQDADWVAVEWGPNIQSPGAYLNLRQVRMIVDVGE